MGLDSYLSASKYIGRWKYDNNTEKGKAEIAKCDAVLAALGFDQAILTEGSPSLTVRINVAYWRKANAIHRWFVEKVQDGVDECQTAYVSREKLQELLAACEHALTHKDEADAALPTQSGFFFGSTDYDEDYFEDLTGTVNQIKPLLSNPKLADWSFEYRSSW